MGNLVMTRNNVNFLTTTVSDRVTIENPYYLFILESKFNKTESRAFNAVNISQNKIRYDRFEVLETTGPSYSNGEVNLFSGEWDYKIYESVNQTLDVDNTTRVVLDNGLLIVLDENYK